MSSRTGGAATEPLPGIPPLELRSGVRLHEASAQPRWSIEFTARSVMGQNLVASSLNEVKTGGFTVLYLRGYWQATDRLLLTARLQKGKSQPELVQALQKQAKIEFKSERYAGLKDTALAAPDPRATRMARAR